ncbi:hypothetical protein RFI_34066 [Reticulomyxa filosa]|uniref:Uncharacterized protein n=1 Tax=Reticulomyxa filosa TaxID=46433 RepID=X6LP02_RETFI|nr:hypothetical protein RFI_34066 [Reticulomyxa filosa]|eukprot:ETO03344.1 hypothetical protein RFI_34066 [Reticulomyxa filosa]
MTQNQIHVFNLVIKKENIMEHNLYHVLAKMARNNHNDNQWPMTDSQNRISIKVCLLGATEMVAVITDMYGKKIQEMFVQGGILIEVKRLNLGCCAIIEHFALSSTTDGVLVHLSTSNNRAIPPFQIHIATSNQTLICDRPIYYNTASNSPMLPLDKGICLENDLNTTACGNV